MKYESRYLLEIFSICSSHVCANLRKKFWPLLNQPASHGPFRPKLWMPLATIFVEIFEKEKKWWGSGPIGVTSWKDFEISSKKWRFEFFCWAKASTFKMSMDRRTFIMFLLGCCSGGVSTCATGSIATINFYKFIRLSKKRRIEIRWDLTEYV